MLRNPNAKLNLNPKTAPDAQGMDENNSGTIAARLLKEDIEWLKSLPEGASYHVRQAIAQYRKDFSKNP